MCSHSRFALNFELFFTDVQKCFLFPHFCTIADPAFELDGNSSGEKSNFEFCRNHSIHSRFLKHLVSWSLGGLWRLQ